VARTERTWSRIAALGAALAATSTGQSAARADGAFPDSLSILLPVDRPHQITLATNFGLVSSYDDGVSSTWVCEGDLTNASTLYTMSAAPRDRLYALSSDNLVFSDDDGCDWSIAKGAVAAGGVVDAYPFPDDAERMLAVVSPSGVGSQTAYTVVASHDGGSTFDEVVYTAAGGDIVTGVEVARADPGNLYLTLASGNGFLPKIAVSIDGGAGWRDVDLSPALGSSSIRLIAVDRTNPGRVFLRVSAISGESLALFDATDGTFSVPLTLVGGLLTAFVQTAEGPLVAAGRVHADAAVYRSTDGGQRFQPVLAAPHLRALGERAGKLFGAGDKSVDGFTILASTDLGLTYQPLIRLDQVHAIASCVRASCRDTCRNEAAVGVWPFAMCDAAPEPKAKELSAGGGCRMGIGREPTEGAAVSFALAIMALSTLRRTKVHVPRRRAFVPL
jgi:hypothetical protein